MKHVHTYYQEQLDNCASYIVHNNFYCLYDQKSLAALIIDNSKELLLLNVERFNNADADIIHSSSTMGFTILISCDVSEKDGIVYWMTEFLVNPSIHNEGAFIEEDIIL
jgi:hypothetical protein